MYPRLLHRFVPIGLAIYIALVLCVPSTVAQGQAETPPVPDESVLLASQTVLLPLSEIKAIAAGDYHSCALTEAGGVKCWGDNNSGQLGDGNSGTNSDTPVDVVGLTSDVVAIASGYLHTCALTEAGGVKCWGYNIRGQLGSGDSPTFDTRSIDTPVDVIGLTSGVKAITTGYYHTCALTEAGGVKCWGGNDYGELGDGNSPTDSVTPVNVSGLDSGVKAIAAGSQHTCALTDTGVKCWGHNGYGQLGDGNKPTKSDTPVNVLGLGSGVMAISAGGGHVCALTEAGGVKCWGWNSSGQLGDGNSPTDSDTLVSVRGLGSGVKAIAAGSSHTCALTESGSLKCWGSNSRGGLGDGNTQTDSDTPVDVIGLASRIDAVVAGSGHTCALTETGGVKCWGWNYRGQLGDGTTIDRAVSGDVLTPQTCYELSITHSGQGDIPVAEPDHTNGCPANHFLKDETIILTGKPDANQRIESWTGTDSSPDTGALVNTLTMPSSDHTVSTAYETCFLLSTQISGQGDPLVATPTSSTGCASGRYVGGQSIVLTSAPASDWIVQGWNGTSDDESSTLNNSLVMPDGDHVVGVTYAEQDDTDTLYLPTLHQ